MRCFSIRQRYNLKANHNCINGFPPQTKVVFQYVKDTIWKQITTLIGFMFSPYKLFFNTSKIQFESKSQPSMSIVSMIICCFSIRQRYNLKANHNTRRRMCTDQAVVFQYVKDTIWKQITTYTAVGVKRYLLFFNTSKIQFESKSQRWRLPSANGRSCFSIRQRYNLKANHNMLSA